MASTSTPAVREGSLRKRELLPTDAERKAFLDDVRSGMDPSTAAGKLVRPNGTIRTATEFGRVANRDAEFAAAYDEALAERASVNADRADRLMETIAHKDDAPVGIIVAWASGWNPRYRREGRERRAGEADGVLELPRPQIDVSLLTDSQVERLDAILREAELLIAIGQGRAPNVGREALPAAQE